MPAQGFDAALDFAFAEVRSASRQLEQLAQGTLGQADRGRRTYQTQRVATETDADAKGSFERLQIGSAGAGECEQEIVVENLHFLGYAGRLTRGFRLDFWHVTPGVFSTSAIAPWIVVSSTRYHAGTTPASRKL